jgi:hypothetical protein
MRSHIEPMKKIARSLRTPGKLPEPESTHDFF